MMKNTKTALRLLSLLLMLSLLFSAVPVLADEEGAPYPSLDFRVPTHTAKVGTNEITFTLTYKPAFRKEQLNVSIYENATEKCCVQKTVTETHSYGEKTITYRFTLDISKLKAGTYTAIARTKYYKGGKYRVSPNVSWTRLIITGKDKPNATVRGFSIVEEGRQKFVLNSRTIYRTRDRYFYVKGIDFYPKDAKDTDLVWKSTDSSVAIVMPGGLVKTVGVGECKIVATTTDGGYVQRYFKINVYK